MRPMAVVFEAARDGQYARELADRVFIESGPGTWMDVADLEHQRTWVEHSPDGSVFSWVGIARLAKDARIKVHGMFEGNPGEMDASAARKALRYFESQQPDIRGVILLSDQDGYPERRNGLIQARTHFADKSLSIVIAIANVELENWILCGFEPRSDEESARLDDLQIRLQYHPIDANHRLDHWKSDRHADSPKRALTELLGDDPERVADCWRMIPLATLRTRGGANGLKDFLTEIADRLKPILST